MIKKFSTKVNNFLSGKILPHFLVRELSVQQKLVIFEDNFKNENDLQNDYRVTYKVFCDVLARRRSDYFPLGAFFGIKVEEPLFRSPPHLGGQGGSR